MTSLPICRQDFDADFDAMVAGILPGYDGPPYALVRFADGEAAIMNGREHVAKSDGWRWPADPVLAADAANRTSYGYDATKLPTQLFLALTENASGYYIGITAEEHHPREWDELMDWVWDERVQTPETQITFAELFIFANYDRWLSLDTTHCLIVAPRSPLGHFNVPPDAVMTGWDHRPLVDALMLLSPGGPPILVAAGPLANIIIHDYWLRCPADRKRVILDIGSALNIGGQRIRSYQRQNHPQRSWRPKWQLTKPPGRA